MIGHPHTFRRNWFKQKENRSPLNDPRSAFPDILERLGSVKCKTKIIFYRMTKPGGFSIKSKFIWYRLIPENPTSSRLNRHFVKKRAGTYVLKEMLGHPKFATLMWPTAMFIKCPVVLIESN